MVNVPSEILQMPVADLVPYSRNARTHSEAQVLQIADSIREFGFTNPVLVSDDNSIIAGHGRVLAAQSLGLETVPCIRLSHLTDAQRRAYILADNKLALNAGWDDELLRLELGELRDEGFALGLIGFSGSELDALFLDGDNVEASGLTEDDAVPEARPRPVSRPGDVWVCGDHRVICGSSVEIDVVEQLMSGQLADCVWTDPPYNVAYETEAGSIANDDLPDEEFRRFLEDAFVTAFAVMAPGAPIYVAHADTEGLNFRGAFKDAGFKLSGCLIWVKPALVLGRSDYQWRHEPILYGWKPGAAHQWFGGRAKTTVHEAEAPPFVLTADGSVEIDLGGSNVLRISGADLHVEEVVGSTIKVPKPRKNPDHPTMKPVELIVAQLKNSTRRGDVVLDLFGGSGSTLIACEKLGRSARLVELDAVYCDVIVRRWQDWTGRKATLEASGETFAALDASRLGSDKKAKGRAVKKEAAA